MVIKILEIASNDGSFLKFIKKKYKCTLVGVDPAMNLAKKLKNQNNKKLLRS